MKEPAEVAAAQQSVRIVEVAPRDGLQTEPTELGTATKRLLIEHAIGYGADRVEVASFVHPGVVPKMADAESLVASLDDASRDRYTALILNERGVHRAIAAGLAEVNMVVHCTDSFSERNQGTDVAGGLEIWHRVASVARDAGVRTSVTLAVAFGCPFEGEVPIERVVEIASHVLDSPPDELSLADTIGVAVPTDVERRFAAIGSLTASGPSLRAHFHNTRGNGTANALAAIGVGVTALDVSLGGIGGCPFAPRATGNLATEDLLYALDRSGIRCSLDSSAVLAASSWLEHQVGHPLPAMVTSAGWFPSALSDPERSYEVGKFSRSD